MAQHVQAVLNICLLEITEKQEGLRNHSSSVLTSPRKDNQTESRQHWDKLQPSLDVQVTVSNQRNARLASGFKSMPQLGHGHWTLALWQSCFYTGAATKCSVPAADTASARGNSAPMGTGATWTGSAIRPQSGTGYKNCHATYRTRESS